MGFVSREQEGSLGGRERARISGREVEEGRKGRRGRDRGGIPSEPSLKQLSHSSELKLTFQKDEEVIFFCYKREETRN